MSGRHMRLLDGVHVLEVGGFIAGPLAAMILAEYGTDVVKLEQRGAGDPFRAFAGGTYSPQFQAHNRNKRSVAVDYGSPEGLAILLQLVERTDVFINNNRPGVADKLGFGPKRTSSGCTSTRPSTRWCCAATRRAKCKPWTAPSQACR
ncbi:MAG: hypothetical protein EXR28_06030 [Betaproteobacteria bacterium]|nr:hypothetical protein [Betaproteobacteria bacterium]